MRMDYQSDGVLIHLREAGQMWDPATGRSNKWDRGLKLQHKGKTVTLDGAVVISLVELVNSPEILAWLSTAPKKDDTE